MPFALSAALPDGKLETHLLVAGETTFGRKGADICFEEKSVSRQHAKILIEPLDAASQPATRPKVTVVDSSKFGTFLFRDTGGEPDRVPTGELATGKFVGPSSVNLYVSDPSRRASLQARRVCN